MVELDDDGNDVRPLVVSADVGYSLENHQPLVYKAGAPQSGSVHSSSLKKRNPSSAVMPIARQSRKVTGTSFEEWLKIAADFRKGGESRPDDTGGFQPTAAGCRISFSGVEGSHDGVLLWQGYFF